MTKTSSQEEQKYKKKYEELKKKLQDLEENNKNLDLKIIKTKKCIKRLKVEKGFLLEKLDKIKKTSDIDSDDSEIENNTPQQTVKVEEKHQRKKQKVVDPLAPKKPANAFFRFCQLQRKNMNSQINQIKSEDSSNSDITKILSNQWKQLPKEEKQIYYDLYEKDKVRYEKELEAYNNSDHKKNKDLASGKGQTKPKSKSTSTNKNTNKSNSNNPSTPSSIKQVTTNDDTKSEPATDDINSVNDAQTEFSFNNVTNNDDMQIDETNDKKSNVNTTNKERKDINEEDTTISNINEVHPLSRSTSVDYSGETTQSIIDSTMDDSNDNDNNNGNENDHDHEDEDNDNDNDDNDHDHDHEDEDNNENDENDNDNDHEDEEEENNEEEDNDEDNNNYRSQDEEMESNFTDDKEEEEEEEENEDEEEVEDEENGDGDDQGINDEEMN